MSVFEPAPTENPLETLVGEGKKYKTVEELAKAYLHADQTIAQRNREHEELRVELAARQSVEELLQKASTPNPATQPEPEAHQPAKPALTADELAALVRNEISKTSQEAQTASNVNTVASKLIEIYGDEAKANAYVRQRAAELGVSVEFLQDAAAKSPKAFFTVIGLDEKAVNASPTRSDVNPQAFSQSNPGQVKAGTYKFYESLRKSNPSAYFSPKIQNQMHREALEKGSSFFE